MYRDSDCLNKILIKLLKLLFDCLFVYQTVYTYCLFSIMNLVIFLATLFLIHLYGVSRNG